MTNLFDTYEGFEIDTLEKVFNRVCDEDDWRAPISAVCKGECVSVTVAAIRFYTATNPKVNLNVETMDYLVTSEGYRLGPAGDH